jgi:hypothetical protein
MLHVTPLGYFTHTAFYNHAHRLRPKTYFYSNSNMGSSEAPAGILNNFWIQAAQFQKRKRPLWLGWAYLTKKVKSTRALAPRGLLQPAYVFLCLIYTKRSRAPQKGPGQF